jgi:hypothetical protein
MDASNNPPESVQMPTKNKLFGRSKPGSRTPDARKRPARRFRAALASICVELGKDFAALPATDRARVLLLAGLIVKAEQQAAAMAAGRPVDSDEQVRVSGALSRLLDDLALSPRAPAHDERTLGPLSPSARRDGRGTRPVRVVLLDAGDEAQAGATADPDGGITIRIGPEDVGQLCTPPLVDAEDSESTEEGAGSTPWT